VDCGARFDGNDYEKHISCFSESEKYAGKRDKKQDEWTETVREALETLKDDTARNTFEAIIAKIGEATVPRKKQKFANMCKSSHAYVRPATVDAIWAAMEQIIKRKVDEREKQKQADMAKKKELLLVEEQNKAKMMESMQSLSAGDDNEEVLEKETTTEEQRKKLKKMLKKAEGHVLSIKELAEHFGNKKALKRLAKDYPETFTIEKLDSSKVVKLARVQEE
jgi:hypothetical protein